LIFRPIVIAAFIAASSAAVSAEPQPSPALQALVQSSGYQGNIARLFSQLPPSVFQRCATLLSTGSRVTIIKPVSFAQDGYPISGLWKQSFPVSGCGNDTIINFYFEGQSSEKVLSIIGIPGETHADLTLQRDGLKFATISVQAIVRDCNQINARDSKYAGLVIKSGKAWQEIWSFSACNHTIQVPMIFVPDATGTTVTAKPAIQRSQTD
jgi:hypothetical protein